MQNIELLTVSEVAQKLKLDRATVYRLIEAGKLPVFRLPGGRTVRVPARALAEWIERHTYGQARTGEN